MAPIGAKLCQNAFQTIPAISFFDTQTFLLMTSFQKKLASFFFQFLFDKLQFLKIWNNKNWYRQIRRRNSLPVVRLFFPYEPWRRGKSNRLCFWSGFGTKHDFNLLLFFVTIWNNDMSCCKTVVQEGWVVVRGVRFISSRGYGLLGGGYGLIGGGVRLFSLMEYVQN